MKQVLLKGSHFRLICTWTLIALSAACAPSRNPGALAAQPAEVQSEYVLPDDVSVRRIAPGVWLHTSLGSGAFAGIPSNGLLIEDGDGSLLVDPGWNAQQAEHLLKWAERELHRPVRAAVVTHFHLDRLGGVPALMARGLPSHGLEETSRLAAAKGVPGPSHTFAEAQRLGPLELFFPGAGHAPDNLVVWHQDSGTLFGGCFVKDGAAKDLGNVGDADTKAWPASIERVRARFPEMRIVVPGHGPLGGPELLTHTQALLGAAPAAR